MSNYNHKPKAERMKELNLVVLLIFCIPLLVPNLYFIPALFYKNRIGFMSLKK